MFILWFEEKKLMFILTCILVEYNMNRTLAESSKKMLYNRKMLLEKMQAHGEHTADTLDMYTFRQCTSRKKTVMELSTL